MSRPSSSMVPSLTSSRPAIKLSRVDLPQPDWPTNTTNSLSFTSRSMPLMMEKPSKPFCRFLIFRLAMGWASTWNFYKKPLLDGAEGQTAHQLFLTDPAENQDRRTGQGRHGGQFGTEQAFGAGVGGDQRGQRCGIRGGQVQRPERLVPAQDQRQQYRGGQAALGNRQQHADHFLPQRGAIQARGFEDVLGDVFEVGVNHPHHNRQVDQ